MKALKRILAVLGIIIALIIIIGLFLPSKTHVERSITINAPAHVVFEQVNTLKNWAAWDPWEKKDPKAENTYEGPPSGVGSSHKWKSEVHDVGSGSMAITQSQPDSFIKVHLEFNGRGSADATFNMSKAEGGTKVTWGMDMDNGWNVIGRYFGLMMDKMIGPDYETGLKSLKELCEKMPATGNMKVEETTSKDMHAVAINVKCATSEIGKVYDGKRKLVADYIEKSGLKQNGPDFAIYNSFTKENTDFDLALPTDKSGKSADQFKALEIKAQPVLMVKYTGPYSGLENVHKAINEYAGAHNKQIAGAPWEVYINNPMSEKDSSKLVTEVYYPVK